MILKKPIVFFDIESTGLNVLQDRIIEISMVKISTTGNKETKTFCINPEMEIPKMIEELTGISNEDVKDKPVFKQVYSQILQFFEGCDLAGYNMMKLDIPILMEELNRVGAELDITNRKLLDVMKIFHQMEQRNLAAAYQFYCNKDLVNAHSAEADTIATYEVFLSQLEKYPQLSGTVEGSIQFVGDARGKNVDIIGRLIWGEDGREAFNFGKHKGKAVVDVLKSDPSYYSWIMNGDFPAYTKKKLTEIKLKSSFKV